MKVTIKKSFDIDGGWFKVIDENKKIKHFSFDPAQPENSYNSEKNAFIRAMALAKVLEENNNVGQEITVYETPEHESEKQTVSIDLTKIDEI